MSAIRMTQLLLAVSLWAWLFIAGCQRASDMVDVTGRVTWNGQPIESGMITLQADEAGQPPAGGRIENGKFLVRTKPGKRKVQIEAVRSTGQRDPQSGKSLGEMYIPARYNRETILEAVVTGDGKNNFEFALKN